MAAEAADARQLLLDLERVVHGTRGCRRPAAQFARHPVVDLLAALPLVSATTLANGLGLAVKTAIGLVDSLVAAGVAVEGRVRRSLLLKVRGPAAARRGRCPQSP